MPTLSALTSPTAVKAAVEECDRLTRDVFLELHGFRHAREYELLLNDLAYDSKAIAAVAFGYQHGTRPLLSGECHGGRDTGNAGWALDRLGFRVKGMRHIGWWLEEVEATVEAYLEMMSLQESGRPFVKKSFLGRLHEHNPRRSVKAFEYKFQNISAVLKDMAKPWVSGYAPMSRYQRLVRFVIEDHIGAKAGLTTAISLPDELPQEQRKRLAKIDWAKRDADNRALGRKGEEYVVQLERERLTNAGCADLADQVAWVSEEASGHGYDIASFETDGRARWIEVKTTSRDDKTPFYVSSNELRESQQSSARYYLYRVFNFFTSRDVVVYRGALQDRMELSPVSYRATLK